MADDTNTHDELSEEQHAAALALAMGMGISKAAADARVSERTIYRWRNEVPFKAKVSELRGAAYAEAAGRLALIVSGTVLRLHELSKSKNLPVALGACKAIMEHTARTRDQQDFEERIAELERIHKELRNGKYRALVNRLLAQARQMQTEQVRAVVGRRCAGLEWNELVDQVEAATPKGPAAEAVVEELMSQVEACRATITEDMDPRDAHFKLHGFERWLEDLQNGFSSLPETIPLCVLQAWMLGHKNHPAKATPIPGIRCEVCLLILPGSQEDGSAGCIRPCPVCGSDKLGFRCLGQWDQFWPASLSKTQ